MLVLSGALAGKTRLHGATGATPPGLVHEVWLLTPEEYTKLGGTERGDAEGYQRFTSCCDLIWGTRAALLAK